MKMRKLIAVNLVHVVVLSSLALVVGCNSMPATITALSKDNAIVNVHLMTPYGSLDYQRGMKGTNGFSAGGPNGINAQ